MQLILKIYILFFFSNISFAQQAYRHSLILMGNNFEVTVVADDEFLAEQHINSAIQEMRRIEKLISSWDVTSQTSAINKNAGIKAVKVDPELFDIIYRAIQISKLTDGAFDISYASMDNIWKFDGSMAQMPAANAIKESVAKVGYNNIRLNEEEGTVFLVHKGMKIGFGAIGKGYAADMARDLLLSRGVRSGIINASGDMNAWGKQPNGQDWKVAIRNPLDQAKAFATLPIRNGAVVTSGNYEKFVEFDGKRYSHIIDPRTGIPSTGLISVTVFAPKAELADALATAIFVMGTEVGLNRINQIPNVACVIVDDRGVLHSSENIEINKL